jgi:hypothetical protein
VVAGLWIVVLTSVVIAGTTPLATGMLTGSDDYMRFVRVFGWLDGGGWYTTVEPRLNAPYGAEVPWSRAADLPLAALVLLIAPFTDRIDAALLAATVLPAAQLLALLACAVFLARPLTGRRNAKLAALVVVLLPNLVVGVLPGRVDHHTWQLLLTALFVAALLRMVLVPTRRSAAATAGLTMALSLWVGGETVPWLVAANLVLAGLWIRFGGPLGRTALVFAAALLGGCLVLTPASRPLALWPEAACDAFSLVTVGIAAAVAAFWLAIALAGGVARTPAARLALACAVALPIVGGLLAAFPDCVGGPYAAVDPRLAERWLPTIAEAQGVFDFAAVKPGTAVAMTLSPAIALAVSIAALVAGIGGRRGRRLWFLLATFLAVGLALSAWQVRVLPFANLFAVAPLAWAVASAWRWSRQHLHGGRRRLAVAAVVVAIGPLGTAFGALDRLLAPEAQRTASAAGICDLAAVARLLDESEGVRPAPTVIAAPVDLGAELLFRTRHGVLGAPYHRNADGIIASQDVFAATSDERARAILADRGAELVLLCGAIEEMQLYRGDGATDTFAERLLAGATPEWLRPLAVPEGSGVVVFRRVVDPAAGR